MKKIVCLVLLFSIIFLTGCLGYNLESVDRIPEDSNVIIKVEGDIFTDNNTKELVNKGILNGTSYEGESYKKSLEIFERKEEIDLRKINKFYIFSEVQKAEESFGEDMGVIFDSNLRKDSVVSSFRKNVKEGYLINKPELDTKDIKDRRVFYFKNVSQSLYLSFFNEGEFAITSNEKVMEKIIEVSNRNRDRLDEEFYNYITNSSESNRVKAVFDTSKLNKTTTFLIRGLTYGNVDNIKLEIDSLDKEVEAEYSIEARNNGSAEVVFRYYNNIINRIRSNERNRLSRITNDLKIENKGEKVVIRSRFRPKNIVRLRNTFF